MAGFPVRRKGDCRMETMNIERWRILWQTLPNAGNTDSIYFKLVERYSEKHRAYHNGSHVEHCLEEFDEIKGFLSHPNEVEIAIWFHDAIYETKSDKNEEKSAQWAEEELKKADADEDSIRIVRDLILATKHHESQHDSDAMYFLDIDLSIFGSPPELYKEYETNIRKEYKWVPFFIFRKKRKEILNSFLNRDRIFFTEFFRKKYEKNARVNLKNVLGNEGAP